ncbi:MAG TPA: hypothetical protein DCY13_16070, partial [Verrucomicrobiales bacterium]|nr:hypothetical protein [Verrucomicrobiales bacterium]
METKSPNTGAARQAASEEPQSSHRGTLTNPDPSRPALRRHRWIAPTLLMGALVAAGAGLAAWKINALGQSNAAAASQPEPVEVVTAATVRDREHRRTTTSIGT